MKKILLFILLTCFSVTAFAQAGIFYDKSRNGEGALVFQNVFATATYIFTYGGHRCDYKDGKVIENECDFGAQRWFFGSDKSIDDTVRGVLYQAEGILYPHGIQDPVDPFVQNVGQPVAVGEYRMFPALDGWVIEVVHVKGSPLDIEDPIFTTFEFVDVVFE